MNRLSQNERIRRKLARDGSVSRNQCLSQFPAITRLGARIDDLEKEGYLFKAEWRGGDYVYRVEQFPDGTKREPTREEVLAANRVAVAAFDRL